ncbi:hypothetical protein BU24DRAFT_439449 [Aaosphaeria arxii CBS 175.79]|uniref:Monopolin complex subunit Csm1/Pcs1 C-terminal domain-containing protein n=1 Tax=Aaosphaeria arxii CBS 175.79 TaxID=1450172 RepID=A0A6A5Y2B1_9PLEO|nr:uncharacterized protein BU24DRAFT_439449 [Aaosphaeria arxii CBS 175.79]KAF2019177.1 hypothetical protein BU24DRAFT_439449 [Aaosphaeria arxii CBS 175.79]
MSSEIYNFTTALVTGGAGGIGKAISERLIADGKKVIIAGRTESTLKSSAKEIGAIDYYVLDTGEIFAIPAFIKKLLTEHPDVDCLVNNAGVQRPLKINEDDPTELLKKADEEININIRGPMHLAIGLLEHFKSKPNAVIVNVSSVLGFAPFSTINPVYNGTKAWMHFWSINLRQQISGTNVRVVEIAPPAVGTDLHRERENPDDNKKDQNPDALTVEEFIEEAMDKWTKGDELITAGPGNKIIQNWEGSMGKIYDQLLDSASEDEMARDDPNAFPTPDSNTENKAPARKPRGRAAQKDKESIATKAAAKPKAAGRRAAAEGAKKQSVDVAKKTGTRGRKPLVEVQNAQTSDTEEVEEFAEEDEVAAPEPVKPAKRGRPAKAKKVEEAPAAEIDAPAKKTRKGAESAATSKAVAKAKTTAKSRTTKRVQEAEMELDEDPSTILETQAEPEPEAMDIEESIEIEEIPETQPPPPRPIARRAQLKAQAGHQTSAGPRRAGSVSDTERDPALRRKVGDLTKKLEAMTTKYDSLKEVATSGKESNFDQLKRRTDQTTKDQDALIKALKQQISEMQSRSADLTAMKKNIARLEKENASLTAQNKTLTTSLTSAQNENKTLSTKLVAARASAAPEAKTVPGSAVKARSIGVVLPGAAEAAKEAQLKQNKIDLYSDLTNLVVVGTKKGDDGEDVYDCLQTGRNGTLHFQLSVSNGDEAYDDAEFVYSPLLNEQRDAELLDLLPDYLTEEICFPRNHVAKFYMKVLDSMAKRVEVEDA